MWAATEFSVALSEIHGPHVSSLSGRTAAACQVVSWYALRWGIEQLHYVLKSGGWKVEKLQFDHVHTCFNALSCYSIVAWRVLCLALGRLVKFQKTSKQPLPGVKLLGQALVKQQHMAEAF